ncbi:MAG: hypothetical protein R3247_13835, partial [Rhodothermales bacterium]|nr:hypothetical protein [Rhodothermales bacterium]
MPTPLTPARRHAARRVGVPLAVALGALLLYFLRFGYDYGTSDQDEIVPYLLHRLDAGVLAEDWFVAGQAAGYGVRTVFVTLLDAPARWLGPEAAVLGVYVLVWIALAWGVFALARQLTGERLAAALAVAGALVLTPQWTLGGNDMAVRMLVPSMAAWTLAVWGAVVFLRARYLGSGLLLGAAAALQALVGLQMAGVLGVALVLRLPRRDARGADVLRLAGGFLLIALPALAPLVLQQTASAPAPGDGPSLFYMMAAFRNPHHYLPFSFPLASYLRFGLLAFLGGLGFAFLRGRGRLRHGAFVLHVFGVVAALGLVGLVFTEGVPVLGIAKLQLFKTTVFAKLLLVILVCGAAVQGLPEAYLRPLRRLLQRPLLLLGLGLGG